MARARWFRGTALGLAAAVLALGVFTARQVRDGEAELARSDRTFDEGELRDATLHARRAASAYAPGAPHVTRAYGRLEAIALGAEAAARPADALAAWRAIRSAALESRHLWPVEPARLERANREIARLESHAASEPADGARAAAEAARRALERDDAPTPLMLVLLAVGFLCALGGLGMLAVRGLLPDGTVNWQRARVGLILALSGAILWTMAVWQA